MKDSTSDTPHAKSIVGFPLEQSLTLLYRPHPTTTITNSAIVLVPSLNKSDQVLQPCHVRAGRPMTICFIISYEVFQL